MAEGTSETPVLDLLAGVTALSLEASTLDEQGIMLARIAALVAMDAPPMSYTLNLGVLRVLAFAPRPNKRRACRDRLAAARHLRGVSPPTLART